MNTLVGKTIASIKIKKHDPTCDSVNVLLLHMTDGSEVEIMGTYGGYTGRSCDEYIEMLYVDGQPIEMMGVQ